MPGVSPGDDRRAASAAEMLERIAANVATRRIGLGLTQQGLADMADLDLRFIQRVERAQTNLSVSALVALAAALEVAPEALFRPARLPPARVGRPPAAPPARTAGRRSRRPSPR
jgi:transcriptional regulator with XRE-family HTH domain